MRRHRLQWRCVVSRHAISGRTCCCPWGFAGCAGPGRQAAWVDTLFTKDGLVQLQSLDQDVFSGAFLPAPRWRQCAEDALDIVPRTRTARLSLVAFDLAVGAPNTCVRLGCRSPGRARNLCRRCCFCWSTHCRATDFLRCLGSLKESKSRCWKQCISSVVFHTKVCMGSLVD